MMLKHKIMAKKIHGLFDGQLKLSVLRHKQPVTNVILHLSQSLSLALWVELSVSDT